MKVWGLITKLNLENKFMRIFCLGLMVVIAVEAYIIYRAGQNEKIILIPANLSQEVVLVGDRFNQAYLEQVGLYVADRLLSVSPENVKVSLQSVLPFMVTDPALLKPIQESLVNIERTIVNNNISQTFYPTKVSIVKDVIQIEGVLKRLTGQVFMSEEQKTVNLTYRVHNGRLVITKVEVK